MTDLVEWLNQRVGKDIPEGFKTSKQWAQEKGRSESHMARMLNAGVKQGVVEMEVFTLQNASGKCWPTPHYRIKSVAPKKKKGYGK